MNAKEIIGKMTLEEKASLCSGKNFWNTKEIQRLGISSMMLTDGPHGLRKQSANSDHLGLNESVPATCFPPACASGNSFDRHLLAEIGKAIGEECLAEDVSIILGPGINIKRSPLCGRNFEYFSEDPLLSGELAASLVNGIQSKNIGACLKHFACNNQEKGRMVNDSIVDERALREIYLPAFETAVKKAKPWTMMCSYNKINGTYACENKKLLTDIARKEWGFDGFVVTDWGAMSDRAPALEAGLDLEMPSSGGTNDEKIVKAVKNGQLKESVLDLAVERILNVLEKSNAKEKKSGFDVSAHNALARKAAAQSAVLLKNSDDCLPLDKMQKIAIIGKFAKESRYQGGGSSKINPTSVTSSLDALKKLGVNFEYADGYDNDFENINFGLIEEAVKLVNANDIAVLFLGLPEEYESEGFDRKHMEMPKSFYKLIEEVGKTNKKMILVLFHGSAITIPTSDEVGAILSMSLGGQAVGGAAVDLLFGKEVPSGRLAETYPLFVKDNPSAKNFGDPKITKYAESIFVGYRFYETAKIPVLFPFGYGLSYTKFEYSDLKLSKKTVDENQSLTVSVKVKNLGNFDASEVVQLYVGATQDKVFRATKELRGFEKVFIKSGESAEVKFVLSSREFAYYNTQISDWYVENGNYDIQICANASEIILSEKVVFNSPKNTAVIPNYKQNAPSYFALKSGFDVSDEEFGKLLGYKVPVAIEVCKGNYSLNSTLGEIKNTKAGKKICSEIFAAVNAQSAGMSDDISKMMAAMLDDMPLRSLAMLSNGAFSAGMLDGIIDMLNGKILRGILKMKKSQK